jgi:hypothetical protein
MPGSMWRGLESDLPQERSGYTGHRRKWMGLKDLCSAPSTAPALEPTSPRAQKQVPYAIFWAERLRFEVSARQERSLLTRTRLAHLPFHQTNDLVCRPGGFSVHASRQPRRNGAERLGRAGCEQQEERRRAGRRNRASNALNRNTPAPWSPHASACPSADIWPEPHFECDPHQRRLTESSV